MADYEDAGDYGDAGLEVPPAPWQYDDGGGAGGSSGFGDVGDTGGYSQGAGWDIMRQQYNDAGVGAGGTAPSAGYPGMNSGLPPDNAGINFPIDYSPPPGMGTDTDMGNPYDSSPGHGGGSYLASLGRGGGGSSYPRGPSIPQDVLRQFINLLRYGGVQRI